MASVDNDNDEELRVGWFTSKGKIKNRRAKSTKWETGGSGKQTLLLTVRGRKSGAFVFATQEVVVE